MDRQSSIWEELETSDGPVSSPLDLPRSSGDVEKETAFARVSSPLVIERQ